MKLKDITCISDLYYVIGHWFTVIMFAIAFGTVPFALSIYDSVWSFLMCAALAFVGAAPHFKDKFEGTVHNTAAFCSAITAFAWSQHVMPDTSVLLLFFTVIAVVDTKRKLLWAEVGCFAMAYAAMVLTLLQ